MLQLILRVKNAETQTYQRKLRGGGKVKKKKVTQRKKIAIIYINKKKINPSPNLIFSIMHL